MLTGRPALLEDRLEFAKDHHQNMTPRDRTDCPTYPTRPISHVYVPLNRSTSTAVNRHSGEPCFWRYVPWFQEQQGRTQ